MSKSFHRHYHSYKYLPAALLLFLFALAIIYNIVAGFMSDGIPVGMVIVDMDGNEVETNPMLWLVMHFTMLALMFIVIVMVAFAWDTKREPRQIIRREIVDRDVLLERRRRETRAKLHKAIKRGFDRDRMREHLLERGHSDRDIEEALDRHLR
jgi:uncharacterized membrane protein YjgN (DUF898 family)